MRLLDLFCGAGGAAMGYHRAGFEVVGVDIKSQKHYPFEFHQADAFDYLRDHGHEFDVIHASPPCQCYSVTKNFTGKNEHPDLLGPCREALLDKGIPWVIENVPGAPMRADYILCGSLVGLHRIRRHRWFETSLQITAMLPMCNHSWSVISVCGHDVPSHQRKFGRSITLEERKEAMGIDWMNRDELGLAIPPAYTEWIGKQLLKALEAR